jgi:hypothetical protein
VNKRRLAAIAKWLEAGAPHKKGVVGFDMTDVLVAKSCGTACCIAGAAQSFFGSTPEIRNAWHAEYACEILDLDTYTADELFCPDDFDKPGKYKAAHAARVIRKLIATGLVDWESTRRAPRKAA